MGDIETWDEHRGLCLCGAGEFVIERWSANYMYGGGGRTATLHCSACEAKYEVREGGIGWYAVRRTDVEERQRRYGEYNARAREIDTKFIKPVRERLRAMLTRAGRTKAIWSKTLDELLGGELAGSLASLQGTTLDRWLGNNVTSRSIEKVAARLGGIEPGFPAELADLERLSKLADQPLEQMPLPPASTGKG